MSQVDQKMNPRQNIGFNLGMGQLIALGLVSGGVFTGYLQKCNLETPILELTFMYLGLSIYLIYHCTQKGKYTNIPIWKFLICAIVDSHATILIVKSYILTSITSVMLLQVFSIPSALVLSIVFLKIKYRANHYIALLFCALGVAFSVVNDIIMKPDSADESLTLNAFYGDLMVLGGAFLYALSNILQEYLIKSGADVFNYLGFLGLFGTIITLLESFFIFGEYEQFENLETRNILWVVLYYSGFVIINFIVYTIVPFFVRRSGATLLNISNLTTIIYSMISDIFLFDRPFYWMYVCGFIVEVFAILIYSYQDPIHRQQQYIIKVNNQEVPTAINNYHLLQEDQMQHQSLINNIDQYLDQEPVSDKAQRISNDKKVVVSIQKYKIDSKAIDKGKSIKSSESNYDELFQDNLFESLTNKKDVNLLQQQFLRDEGSQSLIHVDTVKLLDEALMDSISNQRYFTLGKK